MTTSITKYALVSVCVVLLIGIASAPAGEAIPQTELQALDRAISRELNTGSLGSQTLGDLTRLRNRLGRMAVSQTPTAPAPAAAGQAADDGDLQLRLLGKLESEAAAGGRAARRSLALYYLILNEPEKAREQWRLMGKGSELDVSHLIMSAFIELALGEHNTGKASLASALSLIEARSPLKVSNPVFCQNVAGYRIYQPYRGGSLLPGDDVLLYVEVEGAEFVNSREGGSECDLMFGLKLVDDNQATVWAEPNFGEYAPLFNGPIRDLHAALTWKVPNNLEPGRYHIYVEALEESTKRRGEGVTSFEVAKRPTNPEKRPAGAFDPGMLPKGFSEMQNAFPGAPTLPTVPGAEQYNDNKFDILQRYYQNQKQR